MSNTNSSGGFFDGSIEERLELALEWYVKGGGSSRTGAALAVSAVLDYVHKHAFNESPEGKRLLNPLNEVVLAILEASCGKSHPLVQVDKSSGGSPLLISQANFQMLCCFVVELFEFSGIERDTALTRVARSLSKAGFCQARKDEAGNDKPIEAVTIKGWMNGRDRIYEVTSLKDFDNAQEWVQSICRGLVGPNEFSFEGLTPSAAREIAELILRRAMPVYFAHLRPGI